MNKSTIGFGQDKQEAWGFEGIQDEDWLRFAVGNGTFYARILNRGESGLDLETFSLNHHTNKFELKKGFIRYEAIKGFTIIREEEAKAFSEREPVINRFLGRYIRLDSMGENPPAGRLDTICAESLILNPYVHFRLEDKKLELKEDDFYIPGGAGKLIIPSSEGELVAFIKRFNTQVDNKRKGSK